MTTYDEIASSDHRGEFLDIQMQNFLVDLFKIRDFAGVVTYKKHLMDFTTNHKIFDRANNLNDKLLKDQLTPDDMKEINDLDDLIIKGMLASKGKIRKR